jgi:hypothetical protein
MGYSNGQIVKFAVMAVGFTTCLTGCVAPYWMLGEIKGDSSQPTGGQIVAKANAGLWQFCFSIGEADSQCLTWDSHFQIGISELRIRAASVVNLLSTMLCLVAGLSQCLCRKGNKTIVHAITGLIAGGAGLAAIGIFASNTVEEKNLTISMTVKYGWAFWIYIVGNILVILASLSMLSSPPDTTTTVRSQGGAFPVSRYPNHPDNYLPLEDRAGHRHAYTVETVYNEIDGSG